jgi:hypothetical protein
LDGPDRLSVRHILRNGAAQDDPRSLPQPVERKLEDLAARIVEIDVDPIGEEPVQLRRQVVRAVVDRRIIAEALGRQPLLLGASAHRDDRRAAPDARDLPDRRSDAADPARHQDTVAGLRASQLQAEVSRIAGDAEHSDRRRHRRDPAGEAADISEPASIHQRIILPADRAMHHCAFREMGIARRDDPADAAAAHCSADRHRLLDRAAVEHILRHHRGEAQIMSAHHEFAVAGLGHLCLLEPKVAGRDETGRPAGEHPAAVSLRLRPIGHVETMQQRCAHVPALPGYISYTLTRPRLAAEIERLEPAARMGEDTCLRACCCY